MNRILLPLSILICTYALPLRAKTIYVNQNAAGLNNGNSWPDAFINLHAALTVAQYGDQIWVAKGIYHANMPGITNSFTMVSGVKLYGGFSGNELVLTQRPTPFNETILSGLAAPPFRVPNVIYCENTDSTTLLDGFIIRDGLAEVFNGGACDLTPNQNVCHGGGVYLYNDIPGTYTFLNISNCRFLDNGARFGGGIAANFGSGSGGMRVEKCYFENNGCSSDGGALYILTGQASQNQFRVDSCTFYGNYGYSASCISVNNTNDSIDLRITNSLFQNNKATLSCAGIYIGNSGHRKPLIDKCFFINNEAGKSQFEPGRGGALLGANYKVSACFFKKNSAYLGGAAAVGNIDIFNCLFEKNVSSKDGGAIWMTEHNYLVNNTFVDNQANMDGGALYDVGYAWDTIVNCIFIGNKAGQQGDWMGSVFGKIYIDYSLVDVQDCAALEEGLSMQYSTLTCGNNNLFDVDPLFRDTVNGDYRVKGCSPALNQGDSNWVARFDLLNDLSGNARILNDLPDIGAYETDKFIAEVYKNDISCFGEEDGIAIAIASGGFSPFSYLWNTGSQNPMIDQLSEGNYIVVVTDADGCSDTLNVDIKNPEPLQIYTIITDATSATAFDGAVSIQNIEGGTPPYHIDWSTGDSATLQISSLSPGLYQLIVTDSNGCQSGITVEVKTTSATGEVSTSNWAAWISTNLSSSQDRIITLILNSSEPHDFKYLLSDSMGRNIGDGVFSSKTGISSIEIPGLVGNGIYFIFLSDEKMNFTTIPFLRQ